MKKEAHTNSIEVSYGHWWYCARNEILDFVIQNINKKSNNKIIDLGCGTGSNLSVLKKYGQVKAIEPCEFVCEFAKENHPDCEIKVGSLPNDNPYNSEKFDIITALDVLEHIEDDSAALNKIKNISQENGLIILTVPAHQSIYGHADESAHHFRRYNKKELVTKIKAQGFNDFDVYYFNSILFIPIYLIKLILKILNIKSVNEAGLPNKYINNILFNLFKLEKYFLKFNLNGISLIAIIKNT